MLETRYMPAHLPVSLFSALLVKQHPANTGLAVRQLVIPERFLAKAGAPS